VNLKGPVEVCQAMGQVLMGEERAGDERGTGHDKGVTWQAHCRCKDASDVMAARPRRLEPALQRFCLFALMVQRAAQ